MLRRRGLTEERLWLAKLYAGHRYIQAIHKVLVKTAAVVAVVDEMPCETLADRKSRALAFMELMRT